MDRPALVVSVALDADELEAVCAMMRAGNFSTPASVVRSALWKLARHLDVPVEADAFANWRTAAERHARHAAVPARKR